jgi:uncharacterized protein YndB with AHSA1/START domain
MFEKSMICSAAVAAALWVGGVAVADEPPAAGAGAAAGTEAQAAAAETPGAEAYAPIVVEMVVPASPAEVWAAWTTNEGIRSFFAPGSNVELKIGGPFEIYFAPDAPPGSRGADDCRILSYLPNEMLSFSWNAPPYYPKARAAGHTWVVLQFKPVENGHTHVRLTHLGWTERAAEFAEIAPEFAKVRAYFAKTWPRVLANLRQRFESGPIQWKPASAPAKPN